MKELILLERAKYFACPETYHTENPEVIENFLLFHEMGLDKENLESMVDFLIGLEPKLLSYSVKQLLQLLQDLNWPGSLKAFQFLKDSEKSLYMAQLESCIAEATATNDSDWLYNLNSLIKEAADT